MQVSCPNCSTAYEIPQPVRPRRLRCARCDTEWRVLPPGMQAELTAVDPAAPAKPSPAPVAEAATVPLAASTAGQAVDPTPGLSSAAAADGASAGVLHTAGTEPASRDAPPGLAPPVAGDAIRLPVAAMRAGLLFWMILWALSLAIIAGALFAGWHFRAALEQDWPASTRLFRLLPGGVPGRLAGSLHESLPGGAVRRAAP